MAKVPTLRPRISTADTRIKPPKKTKAAVYYSDEYAVWRAAIIERADNRCEAIEDGQRCEKRAPEHTIYADHLVEIRDGGAPFDLTNGAAKCASHHVRKTVEARAARMRQTFTIA